MNRFTPTRALQSIKPVSPRSVKSDEAAILGDDDYSKAWAGPESESVFQRLGGVVENPRPLTPPKAYSQEQYRFIFSSDDYVDQYITLSVGSSGSTQSFGTFWLRDNCQCERCIHPDTRQRIVDTFSIPTKVRPKGNGISYGNDGVHVRWKLSHKLRPFESHDPIKQVVYPTISFTAVMEEPQGLFEWLEQIYVWGFCFVEGVPVDPEATKALLEKISFIRHTHYGGFWDFTADLTFKDTAYTTEFLGAHTDNTYFTDPARLQLFHLLSHTDGDGGASLLVDGFRAASVLRLENPENMHILQTEHQPFHSSGNDDVCITPSALEPVVKMNSTMRRIYQIRWNNYDRAAKRDWNLIQQHRWYNAARHWNDIITRPEMVIQTQLEPGTALIFDNWRMLHGRTQFTGKRRMCGGYINNDDFISQYRLQKFGRSHVLQHLGNTYPDKNNPFFYI
ncbi:hypothetical protein FE257_012857 [Aspergillus nanangensis]|uniref:trimethyllysine dioxygenase n=1 Tax=Aspergillus nanangensis TaxID=2582783 RepID=A0AAD4CFL3_ASPNN|nr:hypothetical protein FE257_012857 [Aspergillus nanangensis]